MCHSKLRFYDTKKRAGRDAQNTIDSLQEECYICYRLNGLSKLQNTAVCLKNTRKLNRLIIRNNKKID